MGKCRSQWQRPGWGCLTPAAQRGSLGKSLSLQTFTSSVHVCAWHVPILPESWSSEKWPESTVPRRDCLLGVIFFPFTQIVSGLPHAFLQAPDLWGYWDFPQWSKWHQSLQSHSRQIVVVRRKHRMSVSVPNENIAVIVGNVDGQGLPAEAEAHFRRRAGGLTTFWLAVHVWASKRINCQPIALSSNETQLFNLLPDTTPLCAMEKTIYVHTKIVHECS